MSVRRPGRRGRGDPSNRLRAVLALPESREALPALMAGIDDPSPDVARAPPRPAEIVHTVMRWLGYSGVAR